MDMDKAKRSFNIEKGYKDVEGGGGGWNFGCVLWGFEKSVRSRGGRTIWLELRAWLHKQGWLALQIEIHAP